MAGVNEVLAVQNVSKRFKKQQILSNVSFSVGKNEIIAILGASGCGKTSLLKIITGLLEADAGSVVLHGSAVDGLPPEKRNIGMVFQNYLLFPFMTVYENIAFGLRMKGIAPSEQKERIRAMVAMLGIEQKLFEYPKTLSAGQQQRVALARVFVMRFPVILLDEPFSNLDPHLREDMYDVLITLKQASDTSIVLVTHNADEAMILSKKIGIIHKAELIQFDIASAVFRRPSYSAVARIFGNKNALPVKMEEQKRALYKHIPFRYSDAHSSIDPASKASCLLTCHPEYVRIESSPKTNENILEGEIMSIHQLGNNTHVKICVQNDYVYATLAHDHRVLSASRVYVHFPKEHVHLMPN